MKSLHSIFHTQWDFEFSIMRLRLGVRWQAERDTAFEGVPIFELDVLRDSKAVSQPPHSKTLRFLGPFIENLKGSGIAHGI